MRSWWDYNSPQRFWLSFFWLKLRPKNPLISPKNCNTPKQGEWQDASRRLLGDIIMSRDSDSDYRERNWARILWLGHKHATDNANRNSTGYSINAIRKNASVILSKYNSPSRVLFSLCPMNISPMFSPLCTKLRHPPQKQIERASYRRVPRMLGEYPGQAESWPRFLISIMLSHFESVIPPIRTENHNIEKMRNENERSRVFLSAPRSAPGRDKDLGGAKSSRTPSYLTTWANLHQTPNTTR
jgi:hypothetical protein